MRLSIGLPGFVKGMPLDFFIWRNDAPDVVEVEKLPESFCREIANHGHGGAVEAQSGVLFRFP